MAHFWGTVQGNRGEGHRGGSEQSGISARIAGWNSGISVDGYYDSELKMDVWVVTLNEGNGYNAGRTKQIGRFTAKNLDETFDTSAVCPTCGLKTDSDPCSECGNEIGAEPDQA